MYYTVYNTTNLINSKTYIGAHKTNNLDDEYVGSGKYINRAINKHGIENFSKEIIFRAVSEDIMYWIERMLVDEEHVKDSMTYNLKLGGQGGFSYINSYCGNQGERLNKHLSHAKRVLGGVNSRYKVLNTPELYIKWKHTCKLKYTLGYISPNKGRPMSEVWKSNISKAKKGKALGELNSQYGTVWVYKDTRGAKKIHRDELLIYLQDGWKCGRKDTSARLINKGKQNGSNNNNYGKVWIKHIGIQEVRSVLLVDIQLYLQAGWERGRKLQ